MKRYIVAVVLALLFTTGCRSTGAAPGPSAGQPAGVAQSTPPAAATSPTSATPQEVKASATGDVAGDGRPLVADLLGPIKLDGVGFSPVLTLRVRAPGDPATAQVLATAGVDGNAAGQVALVDFAGDHHPYIVVTGRQEAVSDYSAFAQLFRFDGTSLSVQEPITGWEGTAALDQDQGGRPVIRIATLHEPVYNQYVHADLVCKPCPRPIRTQLYGWQNGRLQLLSETSTRLAYSIYGGAKPEQPLPDSAVAQHKQGQALLAARKPADALAPLQAALAAAPDYPDALSDLSLAYAQLGRWPESLTAARQAVKLNPWHAHAQFNLGVALMQQGKAEEAAAAFSAATAMQLDRWEPHYWLGQAYEKLGRTTEAVTEYKAALAINADAPDIKAALARVQ